MRKTFLLGIAAAWYVTIIASAAAFALVPAVSLAQTPPDQSSCFAPAECIQDQAAVAQSRNCTEDKPCCNETRCYYQDAFCGGNQGKCLVKNPSAKLTVAIGATTSVVDLSDYIGVVYRYSVSVAGLIAGIMILIGGLQYLVARGDAGRVTKAKERISNAIIGLVLVLGAYLLLQTVNPDLVLLRLPKVPAIKPKVFSECTSSETCFPCGVQYGVVAGQDKTLITNCKDPRLTGDLTRQGITLTCTGKGCPGGNNTRASGFSGCSDATNNCRQVADPTSVAQDRLCQDSGSQKAAIEQAKGGSPYLCMKCISDGGGCGPSGQNEACCTGFCSTTNKCTTGFAGDTCRNDADCKSNICSSAGNLLGSLSGKVCTNGDEGAVCTGAADCRSGLVCVLQEAGGKAICLSGSAGQRCRQNSECVSPLTCVIKSGLLIGFCADSGGVVNCPDGRCPGGSYCVSQFFIKTCTSGLPGAICNESVDCVSRKCVNKICASGRDGTVCTTGTDCLSGRCLEEGDFKLCVNGGINSPCKEANDCNQPQFTCIAPTNGEEGFGRCVPSGA